MFPGLSSMSQAYSFYEGHSLFQGLTWEFIRERIGRDLREHSRWSGD
jgi:hypothetical protein